MGMSLVVPAVSAARLVGLGAELAVFAVRADVGGVAVALETLLAGEAAVDDVVDGCGDGAEDSREDEGE